jgi:hypothetical protein
LDFKVKKRRKKSITISFFSSSKGVTELLYSIISKQYKINKKKEKKRFLKEKVFERKEKRKAKKAKKKKTTPGFKTFLFVQHGVTWYFISCLKKNYAT